MKPIYEFEFKVTFKNGKTEVVQQSETTQQKAKKRIELRIPNICSIKFVKRLVYPHFEGGKKV